MTSDAVIILKFLHVNVVRNYATYTTINEKYDDLSESNFWRITYNSTLDIAVIDWCKLFGARKETTHYARCEERGIADIETQVLSVCNVTMSDYEKMHESIVDYRNKSAAHIDLKDWRLNIPYLSKAIEVTYASYDIFSQKCGLENLDLRRAFEAQSLSTATAIDTFINRKS